MQVSDEDSLGFGTVLMHKPPIQFYAVMDAGMTCLVSNWATELFNHLVRRDGDVAQYGTSSTGAIRRCGA
jgi:hypothetical protein